MNRLQKLFDTKQGDILNIYAPAGYPKLEDTMSIITELDRLGVDIIELGMPYSDPMADGKTIQDSSQIALENGMNLDVLFQQLSTLRENTQVPVVLMGYFNQLVQYGLERFLDSCVKVGVDGLILPDLPMEIYSNQFQALFEERDLSMSFLVTPETSDARCQTAAQLSTGFLYVVSSSSITGKSGNLGEDQISYFEKIQSLLPDTNKLIGFGIHDQASYENACEYANGAIIGSAFIRALTGDKELSSNIEEFITSIRP